MVGNMSTFIALDHVQKVYIESSGRDRGFSVVAWSTDIKTIVVYDKTYRTCEVVFNEIKKAIDNGQKTYSLL